VTDDLADILAALMQPQHHLAVAVPSLPAVAGLYAIYGSEQAWRELNLACADAANTALYVGKAEDSLMSRDVDDHFGDGRTGSSTVRRSFAALLRAPLLLTGIPRNPAKPAYFANFGLSAVDDARLTAWMRKNLRIGTWSWDRRDTLADIERALLMRLNPPLNIQGVQHSYRALIKAERKVLADQARAWRPSSQ
jgi:hypothetical protein